MYTTGRNPYGIRINPMLYTSHPLGINIRLLNCLCQKEGVFLPYIRLIAQRGHLDISISFIIRTNALSPQDTENFLRIYQTIVTSSSELWNLPPLSGILIYSLTKACAISSPPPKGSFLLSRQYLSLEDKHTIIKYWENLSPIRKEWLITGLKECRI